jgi:hypothetical protein
MYGHLLPHPWLQRIGPVDGPAPLMADLASFRAVSEPIHRQW